MATLIPAIGACKLATSAERRCAERLRYPLVIVAGLGAIATEIDADLRGEARPLYVAMTRTTEQLVMTCDRENAITKRLSRAVQGANE